MRIGPSAAIECILDFANVLAVSAASLSPCRTIAGPSLVFALNFANFFSRRRRNEENTISEVFNNWRDCLGVFGWQRIHAKWENPALLLYRIAHQCSPKLGLPL